MVTSTSLFIIADKGGPLQATLWHIPSDILSSSEADHKGSTPSLNKVADITVKDSSNGESLHGVFWSTDGKEAVTLHNNCIRNWDVDGGLKV